MLTPRVDGVLSFNRTRDAKNKKEEKKKKKEKYNLLKGKKNDTSMGRKSFKADLFA